MPYANIKITRESASGARNAELIKGTMELLVRVLDNNPATHSWSWTKLRCNTGA